MNDALENYASLSKCSLLFHTNLVKSRLTLMMHATAAANSVAEMQTVSKAGSNCH